MSLCDAILKYLEAVVSVLSVVSEELVSIEELKDAIKRIQKVPDDSLVNRISEVLAKMDIDKDGAIRLDDVLKVSIPNKFQKKIWCFYLVTETPDHVYVLGKTYTYHTYWYAYHYAYRLYFCLQIRVPCISLA